MTKQDKDILKKGNGEDHGDEVASEEIDKAINEAEMAENEKAAVDDSDAAEPLQDDETDSPPLPAPEEIEKLKAEAKENHDLYLRSAAEFENFKKRMERERSDSIRYANEDLIKQLLPVVDNLERALAHAEEVGADEAMIEGVGMVHKQFIDALEKFGVTRVEAMEKPFDPNYHEAMMQVETDEHPPNTVVMEMAKGYLLHDRLIRPAIVGVSKAAAEST
ncbi:MAG: nucleotide exchange factor GrpE [Deltaproteobacteria bacterium]|nr:nucleotide exchange factor GrpE [Candidatus Zymogenaceae bacterium]